MKHLPICCMFVLTLATWTGAHGAPIGKFAFERGDDIWIANTDGTGAKKIAAGQSPDLSPDGTKLVFTTIQPDHSKPEPASLVVVDLSQKNSGSKHARAGMSASDPLWSPDGKQIVFTLIDADSHAHIGVINGTYTGTADIRSGFHFVHSPGNEKQDYWNPNWAADGQSIFAQDFENIYQLDLSGKVLKKWVIASLIPNGEMSGASHLNPSPDGKTLLMDVEMNEDARKGWDGPPPAIYTLDLATEKATRLTPEKFYAWDCRWLKAPDTILYVSQKQGEDDSAIYEMSATAHGKDSKLLVKKASFPSAAR